MTFGQGASRRESDFFDRLIEEEGEFNPFAPRGWETLQRRFEGRSRGATGLRMLDIGCGTGESYRIYERSVSFYAGVDLSIGALRRAAAKFSNRQWVRADACSLPFPTATFDVVSFSSVLHHIPDYAVALREARRLLRPGGLLFAFDPNVMHPAMALIRHPRSPFYSSKGVSADERPLFGPTLRRAFIEAGFIDVDQHAQSDIPYRDVAVGWVRPLLTAYNVADRMLEASGLGRWFGTFLITSARTPAA